MSKLSRREMFAGLSSGAFLLSGNSIASASGSDSETLFTDKPEYMFEPGLNYLNTAALGPTPRSVLDRVLQAWYELELDPVMMAYANGASHVATDRAREQLAALINCHADELLITRSATEAMNTVALAMNLNQGDRVLTTDVEHEGGTNCWKYLKRRRGIDIDFVSIAPGDFDVKQIIGRLEKAITDKTRVISISHVIASTGLRMPIAEITDLAKNRGMITVIDGAQAVGGVQVDVRNSNP